MTTRFAPYEPTGPTGPRDPVGCRIRRAEQRDCASIATIEHERDGIDLDTAQVRCERQVGDPDTLLLVAIVDDEVIGLARAGRFDPPADSDASMAPAGWYLFGVIVRDRWRRRGIGRRLTEERLAWIGERAAHAYYFTNARNRASLDLHAGLGFAELTRAFTFPDATFEGGVGVLCRVEIRPDARLAT